MLSLVVTRKPELILMGIINPHVEQPPCCEEAFQPMSLSVGIKNVPVVTFQYYIL